MFPLKFSRTKTVRPSRSTYQPRVEALEDRLVLDDSGPIPGGADDPPGGSPVFEDGGPFSGIYRCLDALGWPLR